MKQQIIEFLKAQLGERPAILGLSGGVDSAVVAALLAEAITPERVYTYHLPSHTNTLVDLKDAKELARTLQVHFETIPIDGILSAYAVMNPDLSQLALGNLKARIRMSLLYTRANLQNGLVVGTGNKTELQLGYFTKYGDGGVDILPIAHLFKTEIWELAKELNLPETFISKAPSAGLWEGQTDEAELGVTYAVADQILQAIEQEQPLTTFNADAVQRVQYLMQLGKHKQALPPHL